MKEKLRVGKNMIIISIVSLLLVLGTIIFFTVDYFINDTGKKIKYEDYTIYEGHKGEIKKYDPSMTVDGFAKSENAYYITGQISTKNDKEFTVITFNLYDEKDKLLGVAVAALNNLEKGKIYDFEALSLVEGRDVENIKYYELKSVELK